MNGRKRNTGINSGSSSILVIFVLLCLTTFATLSLVSANADYKLTKKTAESTAEYYSADAEAEENLSVLSEALSLAASQAQSRQEYESKVMGLSDERDNFLSITKQDGKIELSYAVPVNDRRELMVSIVSDFDSAKAGVLFEVTQWKTVSTQEWQAGEGFGLWDGTFPAAEEEDTSPQIGS